MALTTNREVDHYVDQQLRTVDLAAGSRIFKGALVEWNASGYAQPLTGAGLFAGLAYEEADNTEGGDGDFGVRVYTLGDFQLPLTGATQADMGRAVFATDDATLTFDGGGATYVGQVRGVPAAGQIVLRLGDDGPARIAQLAHHAASFAVTAHDSGTIFTNRGAAGPITATLPQNPPQGTSLRFACMTGEAFRIAPGAAGGIYIKGAKQADNKYVAIDAIGAFVQLVADGNGDWIAVASIDGAQADILVEA